MLKHHLTSHIRCLQSFKAAYEQLVRGDDGMILETAIEPVKGLPTQADVNQAKLSDERVKEVRASAIT